MTKNFKKSKHRNLLMSLPWWLTLSASLGLPAYFLMLIDDQHILGWNAQRLVFILDLALHSAIVKKISIGIGAVLFCVSIYSYFEDFRKNRILEKKRTLADLKSMPWQEFELLVGAAYRQLGYTVEETGLGGADGGIDLTMIRGNERVIVQCKRWSATSIGAPIVREMYGLMAHHGANSVKIVCVGKFTKDAQSFANGKPIELVSGDALLELLAQARYC